MIEHVAFEESIVDYEGRFTFHSHGDSMEGRREAEVAVRDEQNQTLEYLNLVKETVYNRDILRRVLSQEVVGNTQDCSENHDNQGGQRPV
jgi:hypothetical protein